MGKKTIINIYITFTGSVKVKTRAKQDKGGLVSFFLFHCLGTKRVKFDKSLKQQYESTTKLMTNTSLSITTEYNIQTLGRLFDDTKT